MKEQLANLRQRLPADLNLREMRKRLPAELNLKELKKRLQPQSALGVSLESRRLVAEVVRREGAAGRPRRIELPIGADEIVADPDKAGSALAAALSTAGIRERRAAVCLPPAWALTASTDVPEMSADDLRGYLELRAEREFPMALADLRLAWCAFRLPEGNQRATLAAVPMKRMRAVERMLEVAGCRAASISLGLNRYLDGLQPAAVHLLANCDHVDVVVTAGGGIAALRSIGGAAAGDDAFDAAAFCREVRITLGRLPDPLRRQVNEAHFGGVRGTAEMLCRKTREGFHRMGVEPTAIDREEEPAAAEAASGLLHERAMPFEFVAPQTSRWEKVSARLEKKQHRWMIAAGAGVIALGLLTLAIRAHIENSLAAEWEGMRGNVAALEDLQKKIRQFRPWFTPTPETLPIYDTLAAAFPETGEVWAKSIQITDATKVTCSGFAKSQSAVIAMLERLRGRPGISEVQVQQMRGQNPVEFSFTYKTEVRQ